MKPLLYIFLVFGLTMCKSAQIENNTPFTINGASYNYWVGGQPGVSGIKIIINYQTNEEVSFDKIYFQKKEGTVELYEKEGKTFVIGRINTGKKRRVIVMDIDPKQEANNQPPTITKIPYDLEENEAMLVYTYKGKKRSYKITGIQKTETDFYP